MTSSVALLRAVNLGPTRKVAMADLRAALSGAGYGDVTTLLASGNVVLRADARGRELEQELEALLAARFGFDVPVMCRTAAELADVVAGNPFADEPKSIHVTFLAGEPARAAAHALEAADVAPERAVVRGREVYQWHPHGLGRSPLALLVNEKTLGVPGTTRTWGTVTKLHARAQALSGSGGAG